MEKIRIGNDINIRWAMAIKDGDAIRSYDLTDKRFDLYIVSPYKKKQVDEFTVEGNVIEFVYKGKEQRYTGKYHLLMIENDAEDGMHTVDECDAFELVHSTCQEGGQPESAVVIRSLSFSTSANIGGGGVDTEMSDDSMNVVGNRVIKEYVDKSIEKLSDRFDINDDGELIIKTE